MPQGEYFGWNLGLPLGGTYGMLGATLLVTVLYVAFILSYAELACAIPRAGGAFVYAARAFGPFVGFLTGLAQVHGLRGDTSIEERARFDNYYIEHWSPWEDVKVMVATPGVILRDAVRMSTRSERPGQTRTGRAG